ncbi:MAG: cytochrome C oxidase subunit IV family protein [Nocardioides sp.]|uniref:cytochrome C oxidase subunit IV family protein n=1 Tax=Nocardioides sp. TaxID=35761 RepID=UPI0039E4EEE0
MAALLPLLRRPTTVWIVLMLATVVTAFVLARDGVSERAALIGTFLIAAWKVRLVMLDFMELREAPRLGRLVFEAWAVAVPVAIVVVTLGQSS